MMSFTLESGKDVQEARYVLEMKVQRVGSWWNNWDDIWYVCYHWWQGYDELMEEFMNAVKQIYGEKVLIQVSQLY
jgi:hypothetical protein